MSEAWLVVGAGFGVIGAVVVVLWRVLWSGQELARVSVVPGARFRLTAQLDKHRTVTLWCDVDLGFADELTLRGPIEITIDGRPAWTGDVVLGPMGTTSARSSLKVKKVWIRSRSGVRGQTRIARVSVPPSALGANGPTSVVVEGVMEAGPGTEVRKLDLVLAGS